MPQYPLESGSVTNHLGRCIESSREISGKQDMTRIIAGLALFSLIVAGTGAAHPIDDDAVILGKWRTETTKSLVCGGEEFDAIIAIAKRANAFYLSGAKPDSPEYDSYWSYLEKTFKERRCFVNQNMRHMPDRLEFAGPESLEASNKRFKVLGTTIEEDGDQFPAFTLTTRKVRP
jgi:hypothetical protein